MTSLTSFLPREGARVVNVAELLVAPPSQGDFVVGVPESELGVLPGCLVVGEVFRTNLQGRSDSEERVALVVEAPESVLLDPEADSSTISDPGLTT